MNQDADRAAQRTSRELRSRFDERLALHQAHMNNTDPQDDPSELSPELDQFVTHIATCGAALENILRLASDQPIAQQLATSFVSEMEQRAFEQLQAEVKREAAKRKKRILRL